MFRLTVRERVMIAHSFRGEVFGPAQRLHGATYVVEAEFWGRELDADGLVVDIGLAHDTLKAVLEPLTYQNLDELPQFEGTNTTTEYLAWWLWEQLGQQLSGPYGAKVTLRESDVAWASYEGEFTR